MNNVIFHLHLLPDPARLHVIRSFDVLQLIAYSLISAKTKESIKYLNMKISDLSVHASDSLSILLDCYKNELVIYQSENRVPDQPLKRLDDIPEFIKIETERELLEWKNCGLFFVGWYEHILSLFIFEDFNFEIKGEDEIFDTKAFRDCLSTEILIEITGVSQNYVDKIIDIFSPWAKHFNTNYVVDMEIFPKKLAIQNFTSIAFTYATTLEDMLLSNSYQIFAVAVKMSDLTRFLKSWVKGSNSRMRFANINLIRRINYTKLLKGIKYQAEPGDGRYINIWNRKGIKATISDRSESDFSTWMYMFVDN